MTDQRQSSGASRVVWLQGLREFWVDLSSSKIGLGIAEGATRQVEDSVMLKMHDKLGDGLSAASTDHRFHVSYAFPTRLACFYDTIFGYSVGDRFDHEDGRAELPAADTVLP